MKEEKCYMCENGDLIKKKVDFSVYGINIGKFEAEVCDKCKEVFFDEKASDVDIFIPKSRKNNKDNKDNKDKQQNKSGIKNDKNKLTLSCILNTIDGICESSDRIMIMTTNHIEKLDPALIRSGRIDYKLEFTKCNNDMFIDIIEHYYDIKLNDNEKLNIYKNEKVELYSPADLLNECYINENYKDILNILN